MTKIFTPNIKEVKVYHHHLQEFAGRHYQAVGSRDYFIYRHEGQFHLFDLQNGKTPSSNIAARIEI